jgi:hypothetical protein
MSKEKKYIIILNKNFVYIYLDFKKLKNYHYYYQISEYDAIKRIFKYSNQDKIFKIYD